MFGEVKNALHRNLDEASEKIVSASRTAKDHAFAASSAAATLARAGRSARDAEIANHFNSGSKYGLPGSDGSFWSNYYRHSLNNHEVLSLFFADKGNPFNRTRRWFVLFSKLSLSLCLSAAFATLQHGNNGVSIATPFNVKFGYSFIISLILCPYGYTLKHIASCKLCTRANCCVAAVSSLGYCTLLTIALLSCIFLGVGIFVAVHFLDTTEFLQLFAISTALDYASYFYYGVWNWYLLSWDGFLIVPVFPVCGESGCPGRFYPVYAFWPLKKFLQAYGLCTSTYTQDRTAFQQKYPDRVAVDDLTPHHHQQQSARSDLSDHDKSYMSC